MNGGRRGARRVVVTGAAGLIGSALLRALNLAGTDDVIAVDREGPERIRDGRDLRGSLSMCAKLWLAACNPCCALATRPDSTEHLARAQCVVPETSDAAPVNPSPAVPVCTTPAGSSLGCRRETATVTT